MDGADMDEMKKGLHQEFRNADSNKDGTLSFKEVQNWGGAEPQPGDLKRVEHEDFHKADKNNDAKLSFEEIKAFFKVKGSSKDAAFAELSSEEFEGEDMDGMDGADMDEMKKGLHQEFRNADSNKDGTLSFKEVQNWGGAEPQPGDLKRVEHEDFHKADKNNDAKLSFEEIKAFFKVKGSSKDAAFAELSSEEFEGEDMDGMDGADMDEMKKGLHQEFRNADSNKDGTLSFKEVQNWGGAEPQPGDLKRVEHEDFHKADKNNDAKLSFEEIKAFFKVKGSSKDAA